MAENTEPKSDPDLEAVLAGLEEMFSSIPGAAVEAAPAAPPPAGGGAKVSAEPSAPAVSPGPARTVSRPEIKLTFPEEPRVPEPAPKKEPAVSSEPFLEMIPKPAAPPPRPTPSPKPAEAAEVEAGVPSSTLPAPAPVKPAPSSPAPASSPAPPDQTPSNAPKDQIRRVAFLCASGREKDLQALTDFLKKSALTLTKKPLYLRAALVRSLNSGFDARALTDAVQGASIAAVIVLADGLSGEELSRLRGVVSGAGVFFSSAPSADIGKRSMAMDLVMDFMLLPSES